MEKVYSGYELEVNKNVEDIAYNGRMLKIEGNSKQKIIEEVKGKEVTGEFITVNDVELEDGRIAVSGNSKQETREGYNWFDVNSYTNLTQNGINAEILEDDYIHISGTATSTAVTTWKLPKTLVAGNIYTISIESDKITNSSLSVIRLGETTSVIDSNSIVSLNVLNNSRTFTTTYDDAYLQVRIESGETIDFKLRITLTEGTETKKYEQYGASPSPEYSSEVESCGDNVNLFDGILEEGNINSDNGSNETTTSQAMRSKNYIEVLANREYTLSNFTGDLNTSSSSRFIEYDEDKKFIKVTWLVQTNSQWTITTSSTTKYVRFTQIQNIRNLSSQIKLEKGSKATPYSPYGQGCITEVICNKNLAKILNGIWYNSTTQTFTTDIQGYGYMTKIKENSKITISKKNTGNRFVVITSKEEIAVNGTYSRAVFLESEGKTTKYTFTTQENEKYVFFGYYRGIDEDAKNLASQEIQIEISEVKTGYEVHKEQVYTIPTQQPMRSVGEIRDTFIKKNNKWYERHYIARLVLDGTENWDLESVSRFGIQCKYLPQKPKGASKNDEYIGNKCNYYKESTPSLTWAKQQGFCVDMGSNLRIYDNTYSSNNDLEGFKTFLSEQYNAGTPVYVDYVLAEPLDIECTEEQNEILNQLYNTTIYIPTTNIYSTDKISVINKLKYNYVLPSPSPEVPSEVESCGDNVNLFDKDNANILNAYINGTTKQFASNENARTLYISCKPNKTYTIKKVTSARFGVGTCSDIPANGLTCTNAKVPNIGTEISIDSGSKDKYLCVFYYLSTADTLTEKEILNSIKIVKGTQTGAYSPYGQGCINEVICNKNWIDKNKFARKGLSSGSVGAEINKISSTTRLLLDEEIISKPNATYSFSLGTSKSLRYNIFEIDENNIILKVHAITSNANTTFTTLENTRKINIMILWQTTTNEITLDAIANCNIQLEKGTKTDYIKAQSQTYTIPTQQPFRAIGDVRDTFAKKNNKWFERHSIARKMFDGTEDWEYSYNCFRLIDNSAAVSNSSEKGDLKSNNFKADTQLNLQNAIVDYGISTRASFGGFVIRYKDITVLAEFKAWLAEQYNAGTPVYVDYVLAEPIDIECTEEQEIILEKIQNIKLYDGINYIYSLDDIEALLTFEYYYKMKDYDFYLSADGYLNIPSLGIRYLVDLNESSIPNMPESVESAVRVAGRDGDVVLNTTYEPIPFNIVCYTEDNLTAMEKTEQEIKINSFLNSIKNRTKRFAIERNTKFYEVKYNGALTTINFPKFLKFSIPFKSSDSYGKDIVENIMVGNEKVNSNTIKEVGALITIKGPAISPIIALNDYSIEYSTDIIDGARIEIDTNKSTVTHINSDEVKTNVMKYYNHQFPKIENGENELKILSGIDDNNRVNIKWNDLKL